MERGAERAVARSGDFCKVGGLYECQIHTTIRIVMSKGDRFPLCIIGQGHKANWIEAGQPARATGLAEGHARKDTHS